MVCVLQLINLVPLHLLHLPLCRLIRRERKKKKKRTPSCRKERRVGKRGTYEKTADPSRAKPYPNTSIPTSQSYTTGEQGEG